MRYQWCISDTDGSDVQQRENKSREVNRKAVNVDLSFHDTCFMRMDMSTSCAFRPLLTFFSFLFFRRKIPKAPSTLLTINQKELEREMKIMSFLLLSGARQLPYLVQ